MLPETGLPPLHAEVTLPDSRLWHVTLTLGGVAHNADAVKTSLARLGTQHAFLHSMRYSDQRAEIRYWEEAAAMLDAAALALRVWQEHRLSAGLPQWEVIGLEILEREMLAQRSEHGMPHGVGAHRPVPVPF